MPDAHDSPATPHPEPSPRVRSMSAWLPSVVLVGVLIASALALTLGANLFKPTTPDPSPAAQAQRMPAIERPYSGTKPTRPGDRGGWEQLALLGVLVVALGGGTMLVVHSSRKARRRSSAPD